MFNVKMSNICPLNSVIKYITNRNSIRLADINKFNCNRDYIIDSVISINNKKFIKTDYSNLILDIHSKGININSCYGQLPILIKFSLNNLPSPQFKIHRVPILDEKLITTMFKCGAKLNETWTDHYVVYGIMSYRHIPKYATIYSSDSMFKDSCIAFKDTLRIMCENGLFYAIEKQNVSVLHFTMGYYGNGYFEYYPTKDIIEIFLKYDKNDLVIKAYMKDPLLYTLVSPEIRKLIKQTYRNKFLIK